MELIDALHLRGWRPLLLAVFAAIGAAVGAILPQTTSYTSRHIVFAAQLAPADLSPAQVEDFADELRLSATLPSVRSNVATQVPGEFTVEIAKTASDSSIEITSEAPTEAAARDSSRLLGIESARFVIGQSINRSDSLVVALQTELDTVRAQQNDLTVQAGGIDPASAIARASELLFDAQQLVLDGDTAAAVQAQALRGEITALRPLEQQYARLEAEAGQISAEIGGAVADRSQAQNAIDNAGSELVIAEVATRQKSKAPAVAQNMLLLAALNAVALILVFIVADRALGRRAAANDPAEPADTDARPVMASAAVGAAAAGTVRANLGGRRASDMVPTTAEQPLPAVLDLDEITADAIRLEADGVMDSNTAGNDTAGNDIAGNDTEGNDTAADEVVADDIVADDIVIEDAAATEADTVRGAADDTAGKNTAGKNTVGKNTTAADESATDDATTDDASVETDELPDPPEWLEEPAVATSNRRPGSNPANRPTKRKRATTSNRSGTNRANSSRNRANNADTDSGKPPSTEPANRRQEGRKR